MQFSMTYSVALCIAACTAVNAVALPAACEKAAHKAAKGGNKGAAAVAVSPQVKATVSSTIDKWLSDIAAVNSFVDTVKTTDSPASISSQAAKAFIAAQDEGNSNSILTKAVTLDATGLAASQALQAQFGIIGPAINDTISNPGNLQKNLDAINGARCPPPAGGNAITQEGQVQAAAAKAVGIKANPPATPTACADLAKATN